MRTRGERPMAYSYDWNRWSRWSPLIGQNLTTPWTVRFPNSPTTLDAGLQLIFRRTHIRDNANARQGSYGWNHWTQWSPLIGWNLTTPWISSFPNSPTILDAGLQRMANGGTA